MKLLDQDNNEYCLKEIIPFNTDKTIGYYDARIDGVIHRFFFMIDCPSEMYVKIKKNWYKFSSTIDAKEFFIKT